MLVKLMSFCYNLERRMNSMSASEILAHLIFLALCALAIYILVCKILDDWDPNWRDKAKW